MNEWRAWELRFLATHFAFIPFELGFVIVANVQVLYRMQRLAVVNTLSERVWSLAGRLFFAALIAGLLIGAIGNFVAAVFVFRTQNVKNISNWLQQVLQPRFRPTCKLLAHGHPRTPLWPRSLSNNQGLNYLRVCWLELPSLRI